MIYDQNELKNAVEQGERKLAERRQRARRHKRRTMFALAGAGALLLVGGALWWAARPVPAPSAPFLVVTWPKSKTAQIVAPGQTLLARDGQPFQVAVSDANQWNVSWRSSSVENAGDSFAWAPQKSGETLLALCRSKPSGWKGSLAATTSRNLSLSAVTPEPILSSGTGASHLRLDYARAISTGKTFVWVFPYVEARGHVAWDERALSALGEAAPVILDGQTSNVNGAPTPALWQIVSDFNGGEQMNDFGETYASLKAGNLETTLPRVAAKLVQAAPDASIKWVLRLDKGAPEGIVRLTFDGKKQRQAWIKHKGESAGTPVTGWESGVLKEATAPGAASTAAPGLTGTPNSTATATGTPSSTGIATAQP